MHKYFFLILIFFGINFYTSGQNIKGQFTSLYNQEIELKGFDGFTSYTIQKTKASSDGSFELQFSKEDYGMGYLTSNEANFFIILQDEEVVLKGKDLNEIDQIEIIKSLQNIAFVNYATHQPIREQVIQAWEYLEDKYNNEPILQKENKTKKQIQAEINRLHQEEENFLNNLPSDSYVRWFLPIRKLVSNVSIVAQYKTKEIPSTLKALQNLNYADEKLYKSGLFADVFNNHVWFIENSSGELDQVYKDLNRSIDIIIDQIKGDDIKFNEVSKYIFELLEKRSLFTSAEYLSKKLLNEDDCGCLDDKNKKSFEKYGKMSTGSTAPDITFGEFTYFPEGVSAEKLSDLKADYYLVIFAASWCPHCTKSMPKIEELYPELKAKNIEVVLVSLEDNPNGFAQFAAGLPFVSTTDYKKWNNQAAKDYHIYSTPTYFMLDNKLKILNRLKSVEHIKSWVDFKIQ